jgi:hypothetical protein
MFSVSIDPFLLKICEWTNQNVDLGMRGEFDGSRKEQLVGIIGQNVVCKMLGAPLISTDKGFDGGVDLKINNMRVDVKTMARTVEVKPFFACNFTALQEKYHVDYYLFTSLNTKTNVLTICGVINKRMFMLKKTVRPIGTIITRSDGSQFKTSAKLYEIRVDQLEDVTNLRDLLRTIN